jgi:hypothetical protein
LRFGKHFINSEERFQHLNLDAKKAPQMRNSLRFVELFIDAEQSFSVLFYGHFVLPANFVLPATFLLLARSLALNDKWNSEIRSEYQGNRI